MSCAADAPPNADRFHDEDVSLLHSVVKDAIRTEIGGWLEAWRRELRVDLLTIGKEFQAVNHLGTESILEHIKNLEHLVSDQWQGHGSSKYRKDDYGIDFGSSRKSTNPAGSVALTMGNIHSDMSQRSSEDFDSTTNSLYTIRTSMQEMQDGKKSAITLNEVFLLVLTLVSTIFLGFDNAADMEAAMTGEPKSAFYSVFDGTMLAAFCGQLLTRVHVENRKFWSGANRGWNLFDTLLILFDMICRYLDTMHPTIARMIRLIRVARVSSLVRFNKYGQHLMMFSSALVACIPYLIMACICQFMLMYTVAIALVDNTASKIISSPDSSAELIALHGSISRSFVSLFKLLFLGESWQDAIAPLEVLGEGIILLLSCWLIFARLILMMSVMSGVSAFFVSHGGAIQQQAKSDTFHRVKGPAWEFQRMLERASTRDDKVITLVQLQGALSSPEGQASLARLCLEEDVVVSLFHLVDMDGRLEVPVKDLVLSMPHSTDAVDVITLRFETRRLSLRLTSVSHALGEVQHMLKHQHKSVLAKLEPESPQSP